MVKNRTSLHINILEIMAIQFSLQSLCQNMKNIHICIRSDISAAVSYIKNQGGSVLSLFEEANNIWLCCDNVTADYMPRSFSDSTEWKLNEKVFDELCRIIFIQTWIFLQLD